MGERFEFEFDPVDFSLGLCVTCGQVFRWRMVSPDRWLGVDGRHWYEVSDKAPGLLSVETNGTLEAFRSLFRFDWDGLTCRGEMVRKGPELTPYIQQLPGLRLMRPSNAVESFFSFLCTPNNHIGRITTMIARLGEYGPRFGDRPELSIFPSLETIASIPEQELRAAGFGYRGATIPRAAAQLLTLGGGEYLHSLRARPYAEVHQALIEVGGVGPKLADCIALYALDVTEAAPIDTHVWQAVQRLYFPEWKDVSLTHLRYREIGDLFRTRFGHLAGWAHQYLFYENLLNWRSRLTVSPKKRSKAAS